MLTSSQTLIMILAIAAGTMLTRFLPFALFPDSKQAPPFINYIGKALPPAMIGLLVVYCFKDVGFLAFPFGLPELIGAASVAVLHVWKRNTLLSIGLGTAIYMILVQLAI